jgi:hypothetical protein
VNTLERIVEIIAEVIERPTANLTLTVFVLGALTLILLAIDVAVLLLVSPRRKRRVRKTIRRWVPDSPSDVSHGAAVTSDDAVADRAVTQVDESSADGSPSGAGSETDEVIAASHADEEASAETVTAVAATRPTRWRTVGLAVSSALVPLLVLGSLLATYVITGVDAVCAESCHAD